MVKVIEEKSAEAASYVVLGGAFRSFGAANRRARGYRAAAGVVIIHFEASARLGTPEGWWVALPKSAVAS